MLKPLSALMVLALVSSAANSTSAVGQANPVTGQDTYARLLKSGTLDDRYSALAKAIAIPPAERQEVLWIALAEELERVTTDVHQQTDAKLSGRTSESISSDYGDHLHRLVQAVSQWNDPRALQPLVSAAGTGIDATKAIVAFGSKAVPALLGALRHGHYEETGGVLLALTTLIEGRPQDNIAPSELPRSSLKQITELIRELLEPGHSPWSQLGPLSRLALLTGDPELRQEVELLDNNPGIASAYGADTFQKIELVHYQVHKWVQQYKR